MEAFTGHPFSWIYAASCSFEADSGSRINSIASGLAGTSAGQFLASIVTGHLPVATQEVMAKSVIELQPAGAIKSSEALHRDRSHTTTALAPKMTAVRMTGSASTART